MLNFKRSLVQTTVLLLWFKEYCTFDSDILWYIFACFLSVSVILAVLTYDHDYWSNRGIFSPPAWPIFGHIWKMAAFKEQSGIFFKGIYDTYKEKRFLGIHQFYRRTVVICDPELIKRICVNDFQHFTDRGFFFDRQLDPLAESVLYLQGNEWKALRCKISPIFSPIKLKGMLPLLDKTASDFVIRVKKVVTRNPDDTMKSQKLKETDSVDKIRENNNDIKFSEKFRADGNNNNGEENYKQYERELKTVINDFNKRKENDMNSVQNEVNDVQRFEKTVAADELFGGYTADAIVPCAFGVKSHVMDNASDPFAVALAAYYEFSLWNVLGKSLHYFWPGFALFLKIRIIPKKTHEFFNNIVSNVMQERQKGVYDKRGDFIDMMMTLQSDERSHESGDKEGDVRISDMIISANAFVIFLGGFETTSSTLSFLMLELAQHPAVQEKMRSEIEQVLGKHQGRASYEMLQDLTYMDMVIRETLRLYPPFPSIQRLCTKDYQIPGTDVVIERGTLVIFPTLGIQRDEKYFENASAFVPERWAEDKPQPLPGVYMPFGDGPRYCIGKRFALIQMKCCLVKLLRLVRVSPAPTAELGAARGTKVEPRAEPFAVDLRCPMTLHPADARVTLSLL